MRTALILFLACLTSFGSAEEAYLGVYLGDAKLGYVAYSQTDVAYRGAPAKRLDTRNLINAGLMGQGMSMKMSSTSWTDLKGRPIRMKFLVESGGRTQITDAVFKAGRIEIKSDNSGQKSTKTLEMPKDGDVVDDPVVPLLLSNAKVGSRKVAYVLDPMTLSLIRTTAVLKGRSKVQVKGASHDAILIDLSDPRAPMKLYMSGKGDLIKAEGPFGMALIPESKQEALGSSSTKYEPRTDLALSTSVKVDKPISDPTSLRRLVLRVYGKDLSKVPSGDHQSVRRVGDAWEIDIHPPIQDYRSATTISRAAAAQPQWTKPSTHISSWDPSIAALAKKIVGRRTNVLEAALAIRSAVYKTMRPNAGIGVLRNAAEVLRTKEGVCRDYAILTAALLRAARIPAKLASGLVSSEGTFYYHAWVEIYDGKRWIGLDSTVPYAQITPTHVKLAEGNVEDAYVFTFLDKVKLEVLSLRRK